MVKTPTIKETPGNDIGISHTWETVLESPTHSKEIMERLEIQNEIREQNFKTHKDKGTKPRLSGRAGCTEWMTETGPL